MTKGKKETKVEKKSMAPKEIIEDAVLDQNSETASVDLEEVEDSSESMLAGGDSARSSNAAALAAATGAATEMSASFKNFRHHPDMENFYRFIYENDLRPEALAIIDEIMCDKLKNRQVKLAKAQAH